MADLTPIAFQRSSNTIDWILAAQSARCHPIYCITYSPPPEPSLRSERGVDRRLPSLLILISVWEPFGVLHVRIVACICYTLQTWRIISGALLPADFVSSREFAMCSTFIIFIHVLQHLSKMVEAAFSIKTWILIIPENENLLEYVYPTHFPYICFSLLCWSHPPPPFSLPLLRSRFPFCVPTFAF